MKQKLVWCGGANVTLLIITPFSVSSDTPLKRTTPLICQTPGPGESAAVPTDRTTPAGYVTLDNATKAVKAS